MEAAIEEAIPNQNLTAIRPSTACPSPAQWCFDHGMVTRSQRKNAGKKHVISQDECLAACPRRGAVLDSALPDLLRNEVLRRSSLIRFVRHYFAGTDFAGSVLLAFFTLCTSPSTVVNDSPGFSVTAGLPCPSKLTSHLPSTGGNVIPQKVSTL